MDCVYQHAAVRALYRVFWLITKSFAADSIFAVNRDRKLRLIADNHALEEYGVLASGPPLPGRRTRSTLFMPNFCVSREYITYYTLIHFVYP